MHKKRKKLVLSRETLRILAEERRRIAGGALNQSYGLACQSLNPRCTTTCDTQGTVQPTICNTCYDCSEGCGTGGACTVGATCMTC